MSQNDCPNILNCHETSDICFKLKYQIGTPFLPWDHLKKTRTSAFYFMKMDFQNFKIFLNL